MSQPSKKPPFEVVLREDGALEIIDPNYREPTPDEVAARKRNSARCGHVKRRLLRDEPLKGKLLEFALDVLGDGNFAGENELSTAEKIRTGQKLNDYEAHIMVDVLLLHTRLAG